MIPEGIKFEKLEGERKSLPENIVIVETPEARFRIAYAIHPIPQRPEEVKGVDGIVLETAVGRYSTKEEAEKTFYENVFVVGRKQYSHIVEEAAKEGKPLFLADVSLDLNRLLLMESLRYHEINASLLLLALLVGDALLTSRKASRRFWRYEREFKKLKSEEERREFLKKILGEKPITRRDFLRWSIEGILALYFSTQALEKIYAQLTAPHVDESSKARRIFRIIEALNEKIHPETHLIIITLRNIILAQKLHTIAEELSEEIRRIPEVAIAVGASHIGIEEALKKTNEERKRIIERILGFPGIEKLAGKIEEISTIARFDFDRNSGRWKLTKIFQDPILDVIEK